MAHIPYEEPGSRNEKSLVPDSDNILRISAVHPAAMKAHFDLYRSLMHGEGPLTRVQREVLAVAVSSWNGCHY